MFSKVLIANRGEIAVRIIQACHEMNIHTVAVYSKADKDALHVKLANESYCIGSAPLEQSYLNMEAILKAAIVTQADAIHPGYGFLAENDDFAALCEQFNIMFVGPPVSAIQQMNIKDNARQTMESAGIPIVPGSQGLVKNHIEALETANTIGFPVIIKATFNHLDNRALIAYNEDELISNFNQAKKDAIAHSGNPGIYVEKFINECRHLEVQILADTHGNIIHLGERDCTLKKNRKKVLEETPSPAISEEIRESMGKTAVKAAKAINYSGIGTVEFVYDRPNKKFYFEKMKTEIPPAHPITEAASGFDLVKQQLMIAAGSNLHLQQEKVHLSGCSIECRIHAENPVNNLKPSHEKIQQFIAPGGIGVRVDSAAYVGSTIKHRYDPLIARLTVHGHDRNDAIGKLQRALHHFLIEGVYTTIPFFNALLKDEAFIQGEYDANYLKSFH